MKITTRIFVAAAACVLLAGGLWVLMAERHRRSLEGQVQAELLETLARESWAPRILAAHGSAASLPSALRDALQTPGLLGLSVFDSSGRRVYEGKAGLREMWAPMRLVGQAGKKPDESLRVGKLQLIHSAGGGLVGIRYLDRKGQLIAESTAEGSAAQPQGRLRVLEAPLYVGELKETSSSVGLVRLSLSKTGALSNAGIVDRNQRLIREFIFPSPAPSALSLSVPIPLEGRAGSSGGRIDIHYAPPQRERAWPGAEVLVWMGFVLLLVLYFAHRVSVGLGEMREALRAVGEGREITARQGGAALLAGDLETLRGNIQVLRSDSIRSSQEEAVRASRQRDRFSEALLFERMFRQQFLGALVHELGAFQRSLIQIADSPDAERVKQKLQQNARQLLSIISDVEGVTGGPPAPALTKGEAVQIGLLLKLVGGDLRFRAEERGVSLSLSADPEVQDLSVDRSVGRPALESLLAEALGGFSTHSVRLSTSRVQNGVEFKLEEQAERIAPPGLGFDLAKDLALALGGTLETEAEQGRRVCRLRLPVV